jgi:hypothetical protein
MNPEVQSKGDEKRGGRRKREGKEEGGVGEM